MLLESIENVFGKETEAQLDQKNYVLVAQLVQRGLEACEKLSKHFARYKVLYEELVAFNRSKEYEWPTIEWDSFQTKIASLRERLVIALAKSSAELAKIPESQSWPDFFGHAYSVLAEECFVAMEAGKEELFKIVFPAFFQLALQASDKLRQKFIADLRNIHLSGDPLADLMAISGYSMLFSELDTKGFWNFTKQCWDNYFTIYTDENSKQRMIQFLYLIVEPSLQASSGPRSYLRSRWQQMFRRVLRARGVIPQESSWYGRRNAVNHSSLLIRIFSQSEYLLTEPHDVFLALYIFKRSESAAIAKPHDVDYLQRSLEPKSEGDHE